MLGDMEDATRTGLLLVEDDRELRALLVRLFEGQGYAVQAVPDVQSGLHAALTGAHAVMVVDRRLPDGDGVDLGRDDRRFDVVGRPVDGGECRQREGGAAR